ncbi:MAG: serine/threonine protein kinase [Bradymonadaceae bacterium]|nr:serine/threonine protein kinase [Lujinxingiaceae bacterium]
MPSNLPHYHLQTGALFEDKYRVLRELSRSERGIIYLSLQESMGRRVALKVLDPGTSGQAPAARERFLREVKIISKLRHPNTRTIYDFGESAAGVAYMVLEFVEGETLAELLRREGAQKPRRALMFIGQAARALTEAHGFGILHQDLCPTNFKVMSTETERDFIKILDFGMARIACADEAQFSSVADENAPPPLPVHSGTLCYMSPEQLRGDESTFASDLYSLGLILYEVLTGEPAITDEQPIAQMRQHLSAEPLALAKLATLPPELQQLVRQATSKSIALRHSSAEQFTEALDLVLKALAARESVETVRVSLNSDSEPMLEEPSTPMTTLIENSSPQAFPEPGDFFAEAYEIKTILGTGGFGHVYFARRRSDQHRVAVKVLTRNSEGGDATAAKHSRRFMREARIVALLKCPYTISLLDFGETDDGLLFHVYEYLDGKVLSEWLQGEGALSEQRALILLRQILASLAEAHEQGILHRDIKPSNLMILEADGMTNVRVIDFGIAKVVSGVLAGTRTDLTTEGTAVGTPRYMSPEQLRGDSLGPPSDLYSLGLVLFEMLTGRPAIEASNTYHIIAQQITEADITLPKTLVLDPTLRMVIDRLLSWDPKRRFQSAAEVLDALPVPIASAPQV